MVERGIRIAIDDFGVCCSSLGELEGLPVRVLKIDRSFVGAMERDPRDVAIVRSTVELAHRLGLEIVAEGVESREHIARLEGIGCDIGQGFALGRPVPARDFPYAGRSMRDALSEPIDAVIPLRRAALGRSVERPSWAASGGGGI
ncbi:MAG: hypothetical protein KatS3mg012_0934 [Gaiellaceae bacterium]|nr:MAG: hypothetical protein KatS3mg012_0934 [Gaiellaceae bacterium]